MRLALFEPDIPQNSGALLRLGACLGVAVDLIEPCGFLSTTGGCGAPASIIRTAPRSRRHGSWEAFSRASARGRRPDLMTTPGDRPCTASPSRRRHDPARARERRACPTAVHAAPRRAPRHPLAPGALAQRRARRRDRARRGAAPDRTVLRAHEQRRMSTPTKPTGAPRGAGSRRCATGSAPIRGDRGRIAGRAASSAGALRAQRLAAAGAAAAAASWR